LVPPAIPAGSLCTLDQPTIALGQSALLRPWSFRDAEALVSAYQDPDIQRWHIRRADSTDEARDWIRGWHYHWKRESQGHWAIANEDSDAVLGRIALKGLDLHDGTADIAYWMAPHSRGQGLCTRAVNMLSHWAFDVAGFHRITLEHSTRNLSSCRVAAKAGFRAEGVRRSAARHADGWHDMHVHARLSPDSESPWRAKES
jgi:RimJ/RimL family protein N-acetyltransferase